MSELTRLNVLAAPIGGTAAAVKPIYVGRSIPGMRTARSRIADTAKNLARTWLEDDVRSDELHMEDHHETP